jgi:multidrug efflux system membrane fusion protein
MIGLRQPGRRACLFVLSAAALIAGSACGKKAQGRPPRPTIAVSVTPVVRASVPYDVAANGVVTPLQTALVSPQVDGIIQEVAFREGQDVSKGQVLFRLDPRPYQAAYDAAMAALSRDKATAEYAQAEFERYDALVKSGVVTREQADQYRATASSSAATVEADKATLDMAKFNLDNTVIRAPIGGRTGGLLVRTGNLVHGSSGTAMVLINQVRPILVRFAVPGFQLPLILRYGGKGGLPVTASLGGAPAQTDTTTPMDAAAGSSSTPTPRPVQLGTPASDDPKGSLSFIDNAVDTTTGTVQLKAMFDNKDGTLWSGQFVATTLRLFIEDSVLVVPGQAVVTGQHGTYVYVIDSEMTAQQRPVTVERNAGQLAVISNGLAEGERVVADGQSRVTPGARVTFGSNGITGNDTLPGGGRGRGRGGRGGRGRGGKRGADSTGKKGDTDSTGGSGFKKGS